MNASSPLTSENILNSFRTNKKEYYALIEEAFNTDKVEILYDTLTLCQSVEEFEDIFQSITIIATSIYIDPQENDRMATLFAIPFVGNINNLPEIDPEQIQECLEANNFLKGYDQCIILKKWVDLEQIGNMAPHEWKNIIHDFLNHKHDFPFIETEGLDPENPNIAGSLIIGILISDEENALNIFKHGEDEENQIDFIQEASLWFNEMHIASVPSLINNAMENILNMQTIMTIKGFIEENLEKTIAQFIQLHVISDENNIHLCITDKSQSEIDSITIPVHFSSDWIKNTIELIVDEAIENNIEFISHKNILNFPRKEILNE